MWERWASSGWLKSWTIMCKHTWGLSNNFFYTLGAVHKLLFDNWFARNNVDQMEMFIQMFIYCSLSGSFYYWQVTTIPIWNCVFKLAMLGEGALQAQKAQSYFYNIMLHNWWVFQTASPPAMPLCLKLLLPLIA